MLRRSRRRRTDGAEANLAGANSAPSHAAPEPGRAWDWTSLLAALLSPRPAGCDVSFVHDADASRARRLRLGIDPAGLDICVTAACLAVAAPERISAPLLATGRALEPPARWPEATTSP